MHFLIKQHVYQFEPSTKASSHKRLDTFCVLRLDHIVLDTAQYVNPIILSCYVDEDAVGKLKKLAMASSPQKMGEHVLNRYAAYLCVRWLRMLTDWASVADKHAIGTWLSSFKKMLVRSMRPLRSWGGQGIWWINIKWQNCEWELSW